MLLGHLATASRRQHNHSLQVRDIEEGGVRAVLVTAGSHGKQQGRYRSIH